MLVQVLANHIVPGRVDLDGSGAPRPLRTVFHAHLRVATGTDNTTVSLAGGSAAKLLRAEGVAEGRVLVYPIDSVLLASGMQPQSGGQQEAADVVEGAASTIVTLCI